MFSSIIHALCFCGTPEEKKASIKIVNENSTIENHNNEENKRTCSISKEKEFRNAKMISTNTSKPYSTISTSIPYGILPNTGSQLDKKIDKYNKVKKYISNLTKKTNKSIEEIYEEFLLKVDLIIEECKERETISESDDNESKK